MKSNEYKWDFNRRCTLKFNELQKKWSYQMVKDWTHVCYCANVYSCLELVDQSHEQKAQLHYQEQECGAETRTCWQHYVPQISQKPSTTVCMSTWILSGQILLPKTSQNVAVLHPRLVHIYSKQHFCVLLGILLQSVCIKIQTWWNNKESSFFGTCYISATTVYYC